MATLIQDGLAFDDVLLVPQKSDVLPSKVNLQTSITKKIKINLPIISAAMSSVTEAELAIALARLGGVGVIHQFNSISEQVEHVDRVKRSESGMISQPLTMAPNRKVSEALELMRRYKISGIPIVEGQKLVGILTNRDLRFQSDTNKPVKFLMTKENLVTISPGTTMEEAEKILHKYRIEKLLVVDKDQHLKGLITVKDILNARKYPNAAKDKAGRLRVGAAVGVAQDAKDRADALAEAGVDFFVLDCTHAHTRNSILIVEALKKHFPEVEIIAGNVVTAEACLDLMNAGADAIKVGMGAGSTCTTRVIAGTGVPQMTAIMNCAPICIEKGVPLIADGGMRQTGDVAKALGAGANAVMLGNMLAGTTQAAGDVILQNGQRFKYYKATATEDELYSDEQVADSFFTPRAEKLVAEGVAGLVPLRGDLQDVIDQISGGLKTAFSYCGADSISALHEKAQFIQISNAAQQSSHPHNIWLTQEAQNYSKSL